MVGIGIFTVDVDDDDAYPPLMTVPMESCFQHSFTELPIPQYNSTQRFPVLELLTPSVQLAR